MNWSQFAADAWTARVSLAYGLGVTALSALISVIGGSILGLFIGLGLAYGKLPIRLLARIYTDVIRGVPLFVLILTFYYVLSVVGISLSAFQAGTLALAIFCASHVAETLRGALEALPKGQSEAAKSIGLTFWKMFFYVLLPQALQQMTPAWVNTAIEITKGTTLLSVIGVAELLLSTQRVIARTYLTFEFYLFAGLLYFVLNLVIQNLGHLLERHLAKGR